ncbi:hypothetical protein [Candidatus Similichlamydia epinepheli]|uniref:hypothetical protein n=1 Tax=Candidatus Similichlamydia epinepheli TaxID=1903953 RepID=UPI001300BC3D|nr:hypothetical protein [Candidatus Similichlamydia epinepheli]
MIRWNERACSANLGKDQFSEINSYKNIKHAVEKDDTLTKIELSTRQKSSLDRTLIESTTCSCAVKKGNSEGTKIFISPKWHHLKETLKSAEIELQKLHELAGFRILDVLSITDELTSVDELKLVADATEKLRQSNILAYRQEVGEIRGYLVPFTFLFLVPLRHKGKVDWPALSHTIFVNWTEIYSKEEAKKALWSQICFFLNQRIAPCSSLNSLKL